MAVLFPKTLSGTRKDFIRQKGKTQEFGTDFTFTGDIQPMSGKEVLALPVNLQQQGMVKVYSDDRLKVGTQGEEFTGDLIKAWGQVWEVIFEMTNQNSLINHYKYACQYRKEDT